MNISVIIPTLGRSKELLDTVRSLLSQTVLPSEIVIIDQNQPSFPEVDQYLSTLPVVRHIRNQTPGVVPNYNRGLQSATGEIVLFLDDDIAPDPDLVKRHLEVYQKHSDDARLGGVAGRVEQPSGDLDPEKIRLVGRYHRWSGQISANFNARHETEVQIAPGGNMSFYRKLLLEVGAFDVGFDGNGYFFETDGTLQVHRAGYRILFEPKASLKHLMAPAGGARITDKAVHTYYFVKNGIRLYRKHSPAAGLPLLVSRMLAYSAAKALYNRRLRILTSGLRAIRDGLNVT